MSVLIWVDSDETESVKAFSSDVTDPDDLNATLNRIEHCMGEIDTVIYNCGMAVWANYLNVTHEKLELSFKTQACSQFKIIKICGPF